MERGLLLQCEPWESNVSGLALFLFANSRWIHRRKTENVQGFLLVPPPCVPSLCSLPVPLLQPPALSPILLRTQLALQKIFNHIGMLNSAEMSKGLERERLRMELNSYRGFALCGWI